MDEQTLISSAIQGDEKAIEELLERHLPGLRAFIRLRMGAAMRARESCSDLAQSVCREILQHMDRYQYPGEQKFKSWLYATALRKIANRYEYYKAAKRDMGRDVAPPSASGSMSGTAEDLRLSDAYRNLYTPSRAVMAKEHVAKVEQAFEQLTDDYREVIVLSRVVGMSRTEIAAQMNRTEDSVRNLLHRALARLAELLDDGEDDGEGNAPK